jgi:hypothetical protein
MPGHFCRADPVPPIDCGDPADGAARIGRELERTSTLLQWLE